MTVVCLECRRKALWRIDHRIYCNYHFERHMEVEEPFAGIIRRLSNNEADFKWNCWIDKRRSHT